jgi:APA family basic amino acid/polyamine antiporter
MSLEPELALADSTHPAPGPAKMPAEFGLPTAIFIIVASIVGAGVLTTSGYTVYNVGSNQLMLLLWVIGGVIAACGALALCELTAALPRTGGDYVFLHEAYGPLVAFLSGWVSLLIGFAAPAATAAFGAAKYLVAPLALPGNSAETIQRLIATALVVAFTVIHVSGRRRTARVQGWITTLKLVLLGVLVVVGLAIGWPHAANLADRPPLTWPLAVSMTFSLIYIGYAYTGWNAASYLAGEFVEPQRQLPRAILLGTGGVVVLYLGLNVVYALALSAGDVKAIVDAPSNRMGQDAVAPIAEIAARRLVGPGWSAPLSVAIGLMLLSSLSAYILTGPRVIYAMAAAGQFPAFAGRLTARAQTPAVASWLQTTLALALLWASRLKSLLEYAGIGLSIFSMLAVSAVYVLRWKRPDLHRPFRTPGYPVTPAVFLAGTGLLTLAAFWMRPAVSAWALASILAGVPVYGLFRFQAAAARPAPRPPAPGA